MIKHRLRTILLSAIVATGTLSLGSLAIGQTLLSDVLNEGISANQIAQQSQARVNTIVDDTDKIITEYKSILKTVDGLRVYNAQMDRSIERQLQAMEELTENIKNVTDIKRQVEPLLVRMVDGLEQFIKNDIPFQLETRLAGLDRVKDLMTDPDVDASERFRTVFELYQIESDYGTSSDIYKGELTIDGAVREYNILKVGRVGLYFQSDDANITGWWNAELGAYELLGSEYRNEIRKGIRVARQLIAPELILLPMPASKPVGGA
jgi:hypothetical protein